MTKPDFWGRLRTNVGFIKSLHYLAAVLDRSGPNTASVQRSRRLRGMVQDENRPEEHCVSVIRNARLGLSCKSSGTA